MLRDIFCGTIVTPAIAAPWIEVPDYTLQAIAALEGPLAVPDGYDALHDLSTWALARGLYEMLSTVTLPARSQQDPYVLELSTYDSTVPDGSDTPFTGVQVFAFGGNEFSEIGSNYFTYGDPFYPNFTPTFAVRLANLPPPSVDIIDPNGVMLTLSNLDPLESPLYPRVLTSNWNSFLETAYNQELREVLRAFLEMWGDGEGPVIPETPGREPNTKARRKRRRKGPPTVFMWAALLILLVAIAYSIYGSMRGQRES